MTTEEINIARALHFRCRYLPGSFEKRFARSIKELADEYPDKALTDRQRSWLYQQLKRYRRQIPEIYLKYYDDGEPKLNFNERPG